MRKLFVGLAAISFIACNNDSNNDTGSVTDSVDTVNVSSNLDSVAAGSDSVGTKINITPTSDSANKAGQ